MEQKSFQEFLKEMRDNSHTYEYVVYLLWQANINLSNYELMIGQLTQRLESIVEEHGE